MNLGWRKKGWKNSKKEQAAIRCLWERRLNLTAKHQVEWHWVCGHNGGRERKLRRAELGGHHNGIIAALRQAIKGFSAL